MSEKEQVIEIVNALPDYKIRYLLAYAQGLSAGEEIQDEILCERMYNEYVNDTDTDKDITYSLEDCKKEWGLV